MRNNGNDYNSSIDMNSTQYTNPKEVSAAWPTTPVASAVAFTIWDIYIYIYIYIYTSMYMYDIYIYIHIQIMIMIIMILIMNIIISSSSSV